MKETVKVNLGQRLFDLDIDAYAALKKYLDSLKQYFKKSPDDADEILQDIEQRMADVLQEKSGNSKQIVTLANINDIINMMGTAEEFDSDSDIEKEGAIPKNDEKEAFSGSYNKTHRHLYRDTENNIFGGVCAGMAAYFDIDLVWIRLIWVVLFFLKGIGLLAYIILWIVVPAARTTSQKLEMNGIPVTVENIKQAVKSELRKVKDNMNRFHRSETYQRAQSGFEELLHLLGRVVLTFLKVFLVFVGIAMAFLGVALIFGVITISSFGIHQLYIPEIPFLYYIQPYLTNTLLFILALSIVILVPVCSILAGLIRIIFNIKWREHFLSAIAWLIWIFALIFLIVTLASGAKHLSNRRVTMETNKLNLKSEKILLVSFNDENNAKSNLELFNFFGKEVIHDQYEKTYYLHPSIHIKQSSDSVFYIQLERSQSFPLSDKYYDLSNTPYRWNLNDSNLIINTSFNVDDNKIWQLPRLQITILVPEGKRIQIDKGGKSELIFDNKFNQTKSKEYFDKVLIMKNGELQIVFK
jgi:phage shock protein PspC (stress-responsive transcriptional regulator)